MNCYELNAINGIVPIAVVTKDTYASWFATQNQLVQEWLRTTGFQAETGSIRLIPSATGQLTSVVYAVNSLTQMWEVGSLPFLLPAGVYQFENSAEQELNYALAWGLGAYQFTRYKKAINKPARLFLPASLKANVIEMMNSLYLVRDCINTPTEDMGPSELAEVTEKLAQDFKASFTQIIGDDLLTENYACIHTVGRASHDAPRLLDLRWGDAKNPRVTLVGKGVCFDTGGLDLKPSAYMLLMKKDMGGAAHVLGLARMIMQAQLPVCLRVLIPAVENSVSSNAYRPGDVIRSRKGLTVEIGNTDAEGRLVLCDALTEAVTEKPDLLIDISTLTGAARVALGTDLPALFCNQKQLAQDLIAEGDEQQDPLWQLPLYAPYREHLNSQIADINNNSTEPTAGAISAALFLKEFVPDNIAWVHLDLMAWNMRTRPGRPQGGEAMALRALFAYIKDRYASVIS